MSDQPEALQLAAIVDRQGFFDDDAGIAAAEKLKEQHALIVELRDELCRLVDRDMTYYGGYVAFGSITMQDITKAREMLAKAEAYR